MTDFEWTANCTFYRSENIPLVYTWLNFFAECLHSDIDLPSMRDFNENYTSSKICAGDYLSGILNEQST